MNTKEANYIEVDIYEICYQLIHKLWMIMLAGLISAVSVFCIVQFCRTPVYASSTNIYVSSLSQINECVELVASNIVLEQTIDELNLGCTINELEAQVTVSAVDDQKLVKITVKDTDPKRAQTIADTVRRNGTERIRTVTDVGKVFTVNAANAPDKPAGTPAWKLSVISGLAAAAAVAFVIILMAAFRNTFRTPRDIETFTGLNILGVIPLEREEKNSKSIKTGKG